MQTGAMPMLDATVGIRPHHLMIAGTGRAGTTFLVRYLTELGLSTHLSAHPGAATDSYADAGLEEVPLASDCAALPYVIKSPSFYEYIDELLRRVHLDAAIIPVRDLNRAASSRMVVERDSMHRTVPWLVDSDVAWDTWSWSPGGAVFSLNPVDQGRLLAVGFHQLVERLVSADVPIIFLSFPRMVLDADYLFRALGTVMPRGTTQRAALAAHSRVAVAAKIRIDAELDSPAPDYPDSRDLDTIAVRRQLKRMRAELKSMRSSRSWKLTWPLRRVNAAVQELFGWRSPGNRAETQPLLDEEVRDRAECGPGRAAAG
jgi:hypothetical protein